MELQGALQGTFMKSTIIIFWSNIFTHTHTHTAKVKLHNAIAVT